jgi:sirohydrochlorin cobaltochelatase
MMTRGGEHAERDIPAAIDRAQNRHPAVAFQYIWPFDAAQIARFLASQIHQANQT